MKQIGSGRDGGAHELLATKGYWHHAMPYLAVLCGLYYVLPLASMLIPEIVGYNLLMRLSTIELLYPFSCVALGGIVTFLWGFSWWLPVATVGLYVPSVLLFYKLPALEVAPFIAICTAVGMVLGLWFRVVKRVMAWLIHDFL